VDVILLNGGSSSGKSTIARAVQALLPEPWLTFGVDTFVAALPAVGGGIEFGPDGEIVVGPEFRRLEETWMAGLAAMAAAGAHLIVDEVLLSGGAGQQRWRSALAGLDVMWVGVRCDPVVAATREAARGDRIGGMAADQALRVHAGMAYDLVVDTTTTDPDACARHVVAALKSAG
jgi:chloramphenicol 3-O phosphotransferase